MLYLDFETFSDIDLIFYGLLRYALGQSTGVHCMAYCFDDGPILFWWSDEPFPQAVIDHIEDGGLVMAHNAGFEKAIFDHVLSRTHNITPPHNTQWRCSMALGLASGFAGGLDALATGLGLPYRKNPHGARLIREYCAPNFLKNFKPGDAQLMEDYCISDVEVMRAAVQCLRPFTDQEWDEYHINAVINERGLPIDVQFCEAAIAYSRQVAADANLNIEQITNGKVKKTTERKSRDEWLLPKLTRTQKELLEVVNKNGDTTHSFDVGHRRQLLNCDDLDPDARLFLEYIEDAGSSALKKYAVAAHQHVDGRVHNTFLWNGAGRTGRYSGKGLQPHNIRRDVFAPPQAESLIGQIVEGEKVDKPAETMARLLRAMITHEDGLAWVDWSSIEGIECFLVGSGES